MAEMKQNLPFRPLEVRGHGVWDPERKAFYPFKQKGNTLPGQLGIRYFVSAIYFSGTVYGDGALRVSQWSGTLNGSNIYLGRMQLPPTTAAGGEMFASTAQFDLDLLLDSGTGITKTSSLTSDVTVFMYAEIPDDVSGQ